MKMVVEMIGHALKMQLVAVYSILLIGGITIIELRLCHTLLL